MYMPLSAPFTIRIFVPNGDPDGLRIIDRMNWTGVGVVFPRDQWKIAKLRPELGWSGVYILMGYKNENDELPTLYIGEGEVTKDRIESHDQKKDFWDRAIVFTASKNGLNKAHIRWLEYALVNRARIMKRCLLENSNEPQELGLTEAEKADTEAFLREILQILPLIGLHAFEQPKAVATPQTLLTHIDNPPKVTHSDLDTLVVPAKMDGFIETFMGENAWHAVRIAGGKLAKIKYIAAYITQPTMQITHYAPVASIEPYGEEGKYKLIFSQPAIPIGPIPFGDAQPGSMQSSRYTTFSKLSVAKELKDLF